MTKLFLMSDIHTEFGPYPYTFPKSDIAILAGDIVVIEQLLLDNIYQAQVAEMLDDLAKTTNHILVIAGNHEYYRYGTVEESLIAYRKFLKSVSNKIIFLEKEHITLNQITFIGATLWTDFNKEDPRTMMAVRDGLNDYRYSFSIKNKSYITPKFILKQHKKTLQYYNSVISEFKNIVMISHHAPTKLSNHSRYNSENDYYINGSYSSDLTSFMQPNIKYWFHGHTHDTFKYEINGTQVRSNPMGYLFGHQKLISTYCSKLTHKKLHENEFFDSNFIVKI